MPVSASHCPSAIDDAHAAPLLCAGLIGHRCLRAAGPARRLGIYGFGAAAHIIAQVAIAEGRDIYAFTSPGDRVAQDFARSLGCRWAGGSDEMPPVKLEAAIIFAPVGPLVPAALKALEKGGTVVLGGIHMSDIPAMPYRILWGERVVRSIANLTRQDAREFLETAARIAYRDLGHHHAARRGQRGAGQAARRQGQRRDRADPIAGQAGGAGRRAWGRLNAGLRRPACRKWAAAATPA